MAQKARLVQEAEEALDRFNARNGPNGLFLRYCRGRRLGIFWRLFLGLTSAAAFALLRDPQFGLLAAVFLLAGELIETLVLRAILARWNESGPAPRWAIRAASIAATVQALSVSAAIALVWSLGRDGETEFLSVVFLTGSAMDAGLTIRFHRTSAMARLGIYALTLVALDLYLMNQHPPMDSMNGNYGFDLVASLMLFLVTVSFIRFTARTHDKRTAAALTILTDQARLAATEQALDTQSREAERLALVARHANDGVVIYTPTGEIDWINETFTRMTGYCPSELIGRRIEDVIPADNLDPEGAARLNAARHDMVAYRGELRTKRKSGEELWIEANLTPIPGPDGRPAFMFAVERDINEAKAREAELARARVAAEAAMRAKEQFLATMSHELRTPMNGVIGISELLSETELTPDQRLYVDTIVESGQALLAIINDILDLSRLQSGAPTLSPAPLDIVTSVQGALELLRPAAQAKGIALNARLPERSPRLIADGGRLRQIVLNLLGNAIKFTEAGEVSLALTVAEAGNPQDGKHEVRIAVADTGIGIAEDRLGAVFESFTQADGEIGRQFGGTGLGLTISRRLAREMGGDITVASTPGKGSVFTLDLSLAPAPEAEAAAADEVEARPHRRHRTQAAGPAPVILIAEDNRTNAMIVERMLKPEGYELTFAADGRQAVDCFAEAVPDLVLMDISMPGMTGFEALRAIREVERRRGGPRRPVIALTANSFEEDRRACFEAGFDGFLTKPVAKKALLAEIARCLDHTSGAGEALPQAAAAAPESGARRA